MTGALAVLIGFLLDLAFGDPRWMPHPVVGMGKAISWAEPRLRAAFPDTPRGRRAAGAVLAVLLPAASLALSWACLALAGAASPSARFILECFMCYQLLATRELWRQSAAVGRELEHGSLEGSRRAVGMIVGRDTSVLDGAGVARAAVETIAENLSDGVVSPLLYMAVGGAPLGMLFNAVSTMDSMIGYKNERYLDFGRTAAHMDDVLNWVPARLSALCVVAAAQLACGTGAAAWRIWRRDGHKHASPNAGHPEAAMAGALGLRLNGPAIYFGKLVDKPVLGDGRREAVPADIVAANRVMLRAVTLACAILLSARAGVCAILV